MRVSCEKIRLRAAGPDATVLLGLGVWWLINLVQAGCTELANDEAYYHLFAERLAWGYFDHPPVTALLVWAGERLFGGELGVRFFFTLLQPAYLWMLWRLIRPADAAPRDARLFVVLAAATLMLQLYGFLAVPDGPLLFAAALFLWTYRWFLERRRGAWLWLGFAMALMAYSKYHGALVVAFVLAATPPRQWLRPALWAGFAVAALLFVPHLVWQAQHGWASFAYHLAGRNAAFRFSYVTDFVANLLVVFNPLFVPLYIRAWRKTAPQTVIERALRLFPAAFIGFFLLSALRGYVQPQWVIVACFGLIYVLFDYARRHPRTRRYVVRAGVATLVLVVLVRLVMIFNPTRIRFEVFDNPESYGAIARAAAGRPVVFRHSYAVAAKYGFYTGGEAYCQPNIRYRTHQWQFRDDDARFMGREVLIECPEQVADTAKRVHTLVLANGKRFRWFVDPDFRPVRQVEIAFAGLPPQVESGEALRLELRLDNPYPYDIAVGEGDTQLAMVWKHGRFRVEEFPLDERFTLPAGQTVCRTVAFTVPDSLAGATFDAGFVLRREGYTHWFNGTPVPTRVNPAAASLRDCCALTSGIVRCRRKRL